MSYGQNQPWGLQAVKQLGSSTWNGQTSQYRIQSGYAYNIFKGDLVYLGNDGYIHNLGELGNVNLQTQAAVGVFNGCSFQTGVATNPIDPSSPGRSYWPANTVTFNSVDATCDIIDDPNVIFNIQSDSAGVPFNGQGRTAAVTYSLTGGQVNGNTTTGISNVVLNTGTIGTTNPINLVIQRFVPVSGNVPNGNGTSRVSYNNVEVLIQNHKYASRPAPQA